MTGRNGYFTLAPADVARLGLRAGETVALSPLGSRHLRGLSLSRQRWRSLGADGARTLLFRPGPDASTRSRGAHRYLVAGEVEGVPAAYKCRVRSPWWQVPLVPVADLLLTYMNADTPRLTTNTARVRHLNSVHGVYLNEATAALGPELLT